VTNVLISHKKHKWC